MECKVFKECVVVGSQSRINRNIVECKDDMWCGDGFSLICINRNIVECKVLHDFLKYQDKCGINRNIVECKGESLDPDATSVYEY